MKFGKKESQKFFLLIQGDQGPKKQKTKVKLPPGLEDIDMDDLLLDLPEMTMGGPVAPKKEEPKAHVCNVFGPLKEGELQILAKPPEYKLLPSKVEGFVGRQKELYDVVSSCTSNRLVTIIGLPGVGKTSLTKNATHYLCSRRTF